MFCAYFVAELRRQEFERRRKELAESQGKKGQPRQRKKRKDASDNREPSLKKRQRKGSGGMAGLPTTLGGGPIPPGATPQGELGAGMGLGGPPPSPKAPVVDDIDYSAITDLIMQQLRSLPPLTLQEPDVPASHSSCPLPGLMPPGSPGGYYSRCT